MPRRGMVKLYDEKYKEHFRVHYWNLDWKQYKDVWRRDAGYALSRQAWREWTMLMLLTAGIMQLKQERASQAASGKEKAKTAPIVWLHMALISGDIHDYRRRANEAGKEGDRG